MLTDREQELSARACFQRAIKLYIFILVSMFFCEWVGTKLIAHFLHLPYPFGTPLFDPSVRLTDWTNFLPRISHFGETGWQTRPDLGLLFGYPLPCIYIYVVFIRFFSNPTLAYIIFALLAFFIATLMYSIHLFRVSAGRFALCAIWVTLLLGSPAAFVLDRGNIEVFIWFISMIGITCYIKGWKFAAAIFFALAGSMKIYPAIFLLLFLPRRNYKALSLGVLCIVAFSVLAPAGVGPTIPDALRESRANFRYLQDVQINAVSEGNLRWDHSLLAEGKHTVHTVLKALHKDEADKQLNFHTASSIYSLVIPILFLAIYGFRIVRLPLLNQFIALSVCSILLPYVSYEYTLLHICTVFAVFLLFLVQDFKTGKVTLDLRRLTVLMVCFAVLLAPLDLLAFEHFQGQIKGFLLMVVLWIILETPLPSSIFGDIEWLGGEPVTQIRTGV